MNKALKKYLDEMPDFPDETQRKFIKETITILDDEQKCIKRHLKRKEGDEITLSHLFSLAELLDRALYQIGWLFHYQLHDEESGKSLIQVKETVKKVDEEMKKHKPKLDYIDTKVDDAIKRERRSEAVYA